MDNPASTKKPTRRWFQFSLRSFLIGSTLASLGIWWGVSWFRQPTPAEETIPGGLSLWDAKQFETKDDAGNARLVGDGRFTITDEFGRVWGQGEYDKGRGIGRWTWYRPDGRTAITGKCRDDVRNSRWITWNENGGKESAIEHDSPIELRSVWEICAMAGLHVGTKVEMASNRQGKVTLYHACGKRQAEGNYANDVREGPWTFWSEQGKKSAEGTYRAGRRHAKWAFFDESGESRVTHFVAGREMADLPERLPRLAEDLKSPDWRTRVEAVEALGEIGGEAMAELIAVLKLEERELVLRALRAIARLGPEGRTALPEVRQLAESADRATRVEALFALFAVDESGRNETFARLLAADNVVDESTCKELHERLGQLGIAALDPIDRALDDSDANTRHAALDVLAYVAWPPGPQTNRGWSWQPPFQQAPGYRAQLQRILERAEGHSNAVISEAAGEILDHLYRAEKGK